MLLLTVFEKRYKNSEINHMTSPISKTKLMIIVYNGKYKYCLVLKEISRGNFPLTKTSNIF